MWTLILAISCLLTQICSGIYRIDIPDQEEKPQDISIKRRSLNTNPYVQIQNILQKSNDYMKFRTENKTLEENKDIIMKTKIYTLVLQTILSTDKKMKSIESLKDKYKVEPPYKIGFILSMVKKSRDELNELFNLAVKHRDEWKSLDQLKVFERIVHTNVDVTNLVKQLVEIHIQFKTKKD